MQSFFTPHVWKVWRRHVGQFVAFGTPSVANPTGLHRYWQLLRRSKFRFAAFIVADRIEGYA